MYRDKICCSTNSACLLLRECIKEVREGRHVTNFTKTRVAYFNSAGFGERWIRNKVESGADYCQRTYVRKHEQALQLREYGISKTSYQYIRPRQERPIYLTSGAEYKTMARFRLQNEDRASQEWRTDRICRMCRVAVETMDHMLECIGSSGLRRNDFLAEDGRSLAVMRRILERRTV